MNLNISFKQMDSSDWLRDYITEKSDLFEKYFNGKMSATWNLSQEKQNRIVHCHLVGNQMDFFGETMDEDFKAAIDLTIDKIERQIRKHKEITKDHLHQSGRGEPEPD